MFQDYGVLLEDAGHTLRGLFIIDDKGRKALEYRQVASI